jgi:hypothetical protein
MEVDQLSTIVADRMIVATGFAVVAAGAISKTDFVNQSGFFQVAQRVVNGCIANAGQAPAGSLEDIAGSRVVISLLDDLKNRFPLRRQLRLPFSVFLCVFHDGFRLILTLEFVKQPQRAQKGQTHNEDRLCFLCSFVA